MERPASRASWGSGSTRSLASQKRHIEQLKQQKADFEQVASASAQNCACVCVRCLRAPAPVPVPEPPGGGVVTGSAGARRLAMPRVGRSAVCPPLAPPVAPACFTEAALAVAVAQAQKEKERIREENERIKQKERDLKEADEERKRLEALERPRILAAKREKLIAERNARRLTQAEGSEKILAEKAAEIRHKNALRAAEVERYRGIVQAMCENRAAESLAVEKKQQELRRVFVFLDKNCDGVISPPDLHKRLTALGCKMSLKRAEELMEEVKDKFGDLYGGTEGRAHFAWAMKLHQPPLTSGVLLPEWSIQGPSKHSEAPSTVVPERSWDNLGRADPNDPNVLAHPSESHLKHIQAWTQTWENRIICPDAVDCCTRDDVQHPPLLTPRWILDAAPQSSKQESVCHVDRERNLDRKGLAGAPQPDG